MVREFFLIVVTLTCVAANSPAQPQGALFAPKGTGGEKAKWMRKQQDAMDNGVLLHQMSLLQRSPSLREQLEITDEQVRDLQPILDSYRDARSKLANQQIESSKTREALLENGEFAAANELQKKMREKTSDATFESMEELSLVFLPHQLKRIQQLGRQEGARNRASGDLGIPLAMANEMGLDGRQRSELLRITNEKRAAFQAAVEELKKKACDEIIESLTPEHREKLNELVGEIYDPNVQMRRERGIRRRAVFATQDEALRVQAKQEKEKDQKE